MERNPLAPGLAGQLSDEVARGVAMIRGMRGGGAGVGSPLACQDSQALRRDATRDVDTPVRPAFVRDAEKIMHIPAYNRMASKTQVFSFRSNDDITRRGLHVQLVCRIARDIGRSLGLNDDLIEAIALGHDIGHTPFGHAGERFLNDVYHERTGRWFFHNVQSVRVLDVLYGRNLTLQTLDGVICHNGEFEQQVLQVGELASLPERLRWDRFDAMVEACWAQGYGAVESLRPATLEGCVVRLCDIVAYVGKDRQDAIMTGICSPQEFDDGLGGLYNSWALTAFSTDIVEHSFGQDRIQMSEEAFGELVRAKRENYEKIYARSESNSKQADVVRELFGLMYLRVLEDLQAGSEAAPVFRHHIVPLTRYLGHYGKSYDFSDHDLTAVDFISSMTDNYFMEYALHLFPARAAEIKHRGFLDDYDLGLRATEVYDD